MKKILLVTLIFGLTFSLVYAQYNDEYLYDSDEATANDTPIRSRLLYLPPSVQPGDVLISAAIALATDLPNDARFSWVIRPFRLSAEYVLPIDLPISVGARFGYERERYRWTSFQEEVDTTTHMTFAAAVNWHWNIDVNWLNLYTGIALGFYRYSLSSTVPGDSESSSGVGMGFQIGARFFFLQNFAALLEISPPHFLAIGLTFRFCPRELSQTFQGARGQAGDE